VTGDLDACGKSRFFCKSVLDKRETKLPSVSTIGSLPFLEVLKISLPSERETPFLAVTNDFVMTSPTREVRSSWNWTSLEVMIPTSLPPTLPVSVRKENNE
jgi:hypothetical protein